MKKIIIVLTLLFGAAIFIAGLIGLTIYKEGWLLAGCIAFVFGGPLIALQGLRKIIPQK